MIYSDLKPSSEYIALQAVQHSYLSNLENVAQLQQLLLSVHSDVPEVAASASKLLFTLIGDLLMLEQHKEELNMYVFY